MRQVSDRGEQASPAVKVDREVEGGPVLLAPERVGGIENARGSRLEGLEPRRAQAQPLVADELANRVGHRPARGQLEDLAEQDVAGVAVAVNHSRRGERVAPLHSRLELFGAGPAVGRVIDDPL